MARTRRKPRSEETKLKKTASRRKNPEISKRAADYMLKMTPEKMLLFVQSFSSQKIDPNRESSSGVRLKMFKELRKEKCCISDKLLWGAVNSHFDVKKERAEAAFEAILIRLNIEYIFQKVFLHPTSWFRVDFYIPSNNIIFEIDGSSHSKPKEKLADEKRTNILTTICGVKNVVRFSNNDVYGRASFVQSEVAKCLNIKNPYKSSITKK